MGKAIAELVRGERGSRVSDGGKGVEELVAGERGSRVSDVAKEVAELVMGKGIAELLTGERLDQKGMAMNIWQ